MKTILLKKSKVPYALSRRAGALLVFLLAVNLSLYAQTTVRGTVTDATNNEPLPGATVIIVGTTTGTQTDNDGHFRLTVPNQDATLQFSFIGYIPKTIKVTGQSEINVQLEEEINKVDDVVIIGYQSVRRGDISGAISSISSDELKDIPVPSAAAAISGRIAGVTITTSDGSPDAEITIRVRGGGSITQDNSPLLIVDGFPVNSLNDISPSDIETYTVLKDASSTAIYGARGANGVILITTKNARQGKTTVTLNTYIQRKFFPMDRKLEVLSPYEYVLSQYEYAKLRGETSNEMLAFLKYYSDFDDIDIYKSLKGTDWQDEIFGGVEQYSKYYNLAVNGGNEKTQTYLSFTHNGDDGLIETSSYIRDNLSFKLNHQIFDNLKLEFNSRFSNATTHGAGTSGSADFRIGDIITARPVNGLADFIDFTNLTTLGDEEYEELLRSLILPTDKVKQDYRLKKDKTFNFNAAATWGIIKGLDFRSEFGVEYLFRQSQRYWGPLTGKSRSSGFNLPLGQITASDGSSYRLANSLTYSIVLPAHRLTFLAGQEITSASGNSSNITAIKFPLGIAPERMFANFAKGEVLEQSTNVNADTRIASFFGRANYILLNKYIFNFTLRADGSTKFAPGNQWGYFPAASFAWIMSEEKFIKNLPFISNLKLRASYGQAGNNRMDNDLWRTVFSVSNSKTIGYGQTSNPYYKPGSVMPNPDLRWETTITQNIGTDFSLFNNKLSGTVDLYRNQTKDLLIEAEVPASTSYSTQMQNIGRTSNQGIEISLDGMVVNRNDLFVSAKFNIAFNRFKIEDLDGNTERLAYSNWTSASDLRFSDDYRLFVGSDIGLMYGFISDGFYTVDDFTGYDASTRTYTLKEGVPSNDLATLIGIRPGVMKLKDLDGDGHITMDDRQIIGQARAKHQGGFGLNAGYRGFDFDMFFIWKYGFDVYNTGKIEFQMLHRNDKANMLNTVNYANRFKYVDENTGELVTGLEELRELNRDATIWTPFSTAGSVQVFQSEAVEDGSFLRLNNVTLGYSLPESVTSKLHMQRFRVYATVYNAWLWTKYSGYDPEVSNNRSSTSYNNLAPNVDYSSYPRSRSVTAGINVTF